MPDGRFNLKHPRPGDFLVPDDGIPKRCPWIEDSLTILSDGDVTCGLDDPHGLRCFGNVARQGIAEIFANPEFQRLREGLRAGMRCRDCRLAKPWDGPLEPRPPMPQRLVIEATIRCNLRCPQGSCTPNNDPDIRTRDADDLSPEVLRKVMAEAGQGLNGVLFFNYGDAFMHRGAPRMLAEIRAAAPQARITTSTNGIPLAAGRKAEEVVASGIDEMVFTISGMTQEAYARYHVNGRLETALKGLRRVCEARAAAGAQRPRIIWRYLVFNWTDSDAQIEAAIALSRRLGVDQFALHLTHHPPEGRSVRLAPGSPAFFRYRAHIDYAHGYDRLRQADPGLYRAVRHPGTGLVRWTRPRARLPAAMLPDGTLRLFLSSPAPHHAEAGGTWVVLRTPWRRGYRVFVPFRRWGELRLPVPPRLHGRPFQRVALAAEDPWCPAQLIPGSTDRRWLGVMTTTRPSDGTTVTMNAHPALPDRQRALI